MSVSAAAVAIPETEPAPIAVTIADVDLMDSLLHSGAIPPDAHLRIAYVLNRALNEREISIATTQRARLRARREVVEATCTNLKDDLWHNVFVYTYTGKEPRSALCRSGVGPHHTHMCKRVRMDIMNARADTHQLRATPWALTPSAYAANLVAGITFLVIIGIIFVLAWYFGLGAQIKELQSAKKAAIMAADADGDGKISLEEMLGCEHPVASSPQPARH